MKKLTPRQYQLLADCPAKGYAIRSQHGRQVWGDISEAGIRSLVSAGLMEASYEGEIGDYTLHFVPNVRAAEMMREYEDTSKAERSIRGR